MKTLNEYPETRFSYEPANNTQKKRRKKKLVYSHFASASTQYSRMRSGGTQKYVLYMRYTYGLLLDFMLTL